VKLVIYLKIFYVPGFIATMIHRCVALLYCRLFILHRAIKLTVFNCFYLKATLLKPILYGFY